MKKNLSDFVPYLDGENVDNLVKDRKLKTKVIQDLANKGNQSALMCMELDALARNMGYHPEFDEEFDDDEFEEHY